LEASYCSLVGKGVVWGAARTLGKERGAKGIHHEEGRLLCVAYTYTRACCVLIHILSLVPQQSICRRLNFAVVTCAS
jgi:hypothetical protein